MLNLPGTRQIKHLQRYQHILNIFVRHGFGFLLNLLPTERPWLQKLRPQPLSEPKTLPVHFRIALEESGPTFVKLGQMLSTRPDILPPLYIAELAKLQDAVPPLPWEEIQRVIEDELKAPPEAIFDTIDPEPMAAASLGQVHAATLHSGERVVIKVQRPNILKTIAVDLEILQELAHYVQRYTPLGHMYSLEEIADEFANTLHAELDYRREARNAERFRQNFSDESGLYIPQAHWAYTTKRVLTLERIDGIKIDDLPALKAAGHDLEALAGYAARFVVKEVLEAGYFHADPHPGNLIVMKDGAIGVMDFGIVGYLSDEDRINLIRLYTVAVQMDARGVVDELVHIGAAPPDVDRHKLVHGITILLHRYYGLPLKEISAAQFMNDVRPMVFEHRLRLPSNYWLMGKSLSMMEGIGRQLDPEFDIFEFSQPYVTRLIARTALPGRHQLQALLHKGLIWADLVDELPRIGLRVLNRLEEYHPIPIALDKLSLDRLDKLVTRLALSLIIAGMTISLALVLSTISNTGDWLYATLILGFLIALGSGIWVLISILRK